LKGSSENSQKTEAVTAKVGNGRFRAKNEPLGVHWNTIPFATDSGREIFLDEGPVLWIRMRPAGVTQHDFDNNELKRCIGSPNIPLQPLSWGNMHYLRAVDGVGMYAADDPLNLSSTTSSVAFAFSHGEVWAADTTLLGYSNKNLYLIEIVRSVVGKFRGYADFLSCLGLSGPFEWSIGIDEVKHWTLQIPPPQNHINTSGGHRCLESHIVGRGTYELGAPIPVLRDGEHRSHVVINAMLVRPLVDPESALYQFAVHTLCHEFAHVYDHMLRAKALPGFYGSQITDLRESTLLRLSMAAWDEYAASRLSAPWGTPEYCSEFEEGLLPMLDTMLARAEAAKKAFAAHRDTEKTMTDLADIFGTFLIRAAYLVGMLMASRACLRTKPRR
jgi:hypothetical protein